MPARHPRPLSPHIQIYRPQITSVLSILHRITGVGLTLGLFMLTWFLLALMSGPESYAAFAAFCGTIFGTLLLMGFGAALAYHICSGLRHLVFDTGRWLDARVAAQAGWAVLIGAVLVTALLWAIALGGQ